MKLFTQSLYINPISCFVQLLFRYIYFIITSVVRKTGMLYLHIKAVLSSFLPVLSGVRNVLCKAQEVLAGVRDVPLNAGDVHGGVREVSCHSQNVLANFAVTHLHTAITLFYATITLLRQLLTQWKPENTFFKQQNTPEIYILTYFQHGVVQHGLSEVHLCRRNTLSPFLKRFVKVQFSLLQPRLAWNNSCSTS